jgi:hypothetical protein
MGGGEMEGGEMGGGEFIMIAIHWRERKREE